MRRDDIDEAVAAYLEEQAPLVRLLLSPKGEVIEANRHAAKVCGPIAPGTPMQDLLVEFAQPLDYTALIQAPGDEHLLNLRTPQGMPVTLYFSFFPVDRGILVLGRTKEEEEELLRSEIVSLNSELGNLTRALQKSNAELAALNQLKNQFLGMAAHDLRKPVGLVLTYSEFLMEELPADIDEELRGFLNTIHASGTSMQRIIDDFLDVAMIESGKFSLDLEQVAPTDVLNRGIELAAVAARKNNVTIARDWGEPPLLFADPAKLEQAAANLVGNAVEHSPPSGEVTVTAHAKGDALHISVQDQGPGMTAEEVERIFAPFGKGKAKKGSGHRSIGLGLAIARKIIEAHGGELHVDSELGSGSTFTVYIPISTHSQEDHE